MLQGRERRWLTTRLLNSLDAFLIYVVDFLVLVKIRRVLSLHVGALDVVNLLCLGVRNRQELWYVFILVTVFIGFGLDIAETLLPALHWWNPINLLRSF